MHLVEGVLNVELGEGPSGVEREDLLDGMVGGFDPAAAASPELYWAFIGVRAEEALERGSDDCSCTAGDHASEDAADRDWAEFAVAGSRCGLVLGFGERDQTA